jgi:hypothetical protein
MSTHLIPPYVKAKIGNNMKIWQLGKAGAKLGKCPVTSEITSLVEHFFHACHQG